MDWFLAVWFCLMFLGALGLPILCAAWRSGCFDNARPPARDATRVENDVENAAPPGAPSTS